MPRGRYRTGGSRRGPDESRRGGGGGRPHVTIMNIKTYYGLKPCPCVVCKGRMQYKVRTARKHVQQWGRWEGVMQQPRQEDVDEDVDVDDDVDVDVDVDNDNNQMGMDWEEAAFNDEPATVPDDAFEARARLQAKVSAMKEHCMGLAGVGEIGQTTSFLETENLNMMKASISTNSSGEMFRTIQGITRRYVEHFTGSTEMGQTVLDSYQAFETRYSAFTCKPTKRMVCDCSGHLFPPITRRRGQSQR